MGHNSIQHRAVTSKRQKLGLLGWSMLRAGATLVTPTSPMIFAKPLPEVAFLVDAAADTSGRVHWANSVTNALTQLRVEDVTRRAELAREMSRAKSRV
jgi:phytoene synthase